MAAYASTAGWNSNAAGPPELGATADETRRAAGGEAGAVSGGEGSQGGGALAGCSAVIEPTCSSSRPATGLQAARRVNGPAKHRQREQTTADAANMVLSPARHGARLQAGTQDRRSSADGVRLTLWGLNCTSAMSSTTCTPVMMRRKRREAFRAKLVVTASRATPAARHPLQLALCSCLLSEQKSHISILSLTSSGRPAATNRRLHSPQ